MICIFLLSVVALSTAYQVQGKDCVILFLNKSKFIIEHRYTNENIVQLYHNYITNDFCGRATFLNA